MADNVTYSKIVELLDNSQYLAALKKAEDEEKILAGLREAGGQAAVKAFKATEAAAKQAAKETERAAKGPSAWTLALEANTAAAAASTKELGEFRGKINLGAESLGKIGSALGSVDPALGAVAAGFQKVTGVVSAGASGLQLFGTSIKGALAIAGGPMAIAAATATAAVAFAYDEYAESAKAAEEAEKAAKEETEKATAAHEALTRAIRDQRIEQDRLAGRLSDTEAKVKGVANTMKDEYGPRLDAAKKKLEDARAAQEDWRRSMGPMDEAIETDKVKLEQLIAVTGDAAVEYSQLQTEYKTSLRQQKEIIKTTDEQAEAKENEKEKTKESTAAVKDATEAARERERVEAMLLKTLLDEADAEIKRSASLQEAKSSLEDMKRASEEALATEEERIALAAQASREAAVAVANEAQAQADSAEEKKRIAQDLSATLININVDEARQFKAIEDEKTAKAKEEADKRLAREQQNIAYIADATGAAANILGSVYDQIAAEAEAGTDAQKDAALKWWRASQTAAVAEAGINTSVAISKAASSVPPPANLIPMAIAAAQGAATVAAIASQQPPTFTDTPAGGFRFTGESNTIQGAANDTAILFRDPLEGFAQAVEVMARRQAPTSSPKRGGRSLLGVSVATTPVSRLLTSDVKRATRGKL